MPDSQSPEPQDPPDRTPVPAGVPAVSGDTRQLVLIKDGHRFIFRYGPGEEGTMLENLMAMARDPHSGLDWFDAAVLSHQMGQRISDQLDQILKP